LDLIVKTWPLIIMAAISLWYFCRAMIPDKGEIVLGSGDDAQKEARMAERAREYEQKYGTREGNYSA
jgi:hypothetical protein